MLLLKVTNITSNMLEVLLLVRSRDDIVGSVTLVSSDEIWIVDGRHGYDRLHVGTELFLEFRFKYLKQRGRKL